MRIDSSLAEILTVHFTNIIQTHYPVLAFLVYEDKMTEQAVRDIK
jgi:hypothetical protein